MILLENGSKLLLEDGGFITLELDTPDNYVGGYGSGTYSKNLYGITRLLDGTPMSVFGASSLGSYADVVTVGLAIIAALSEVRAQSPLDTNNKAKVYALSDVRSGSQRTMQFRVENVSADSLVKIAPTLLVRATTQIDALSDVRSKVAGVLYADVLLDAISSILVEGRGIYLPEDPITTLWAEQSGLAEIWTPIPDNASIWKEAAL